jgi:hypothetical protein
MPPIDEKYSDDDLAGLTEEERAALLEEDESDDATKPDPDAEAGEDVDAKAGGEDGKNGEDGEDGDKEDGEDDPDKDDPDAAAADEPHADADAAAAAKAAKDEPEAKPARQRQDHDDTPRFKAPENAKEKLDEINQKRADLRKQFTDGEITDAEYFDQVDTLDDERADLRMALKLHEAEQESAQQRAERRAEEWVSGDVASFLQEHKDVYDGNDELLQSLDAQVRAIQTVALNKGEDQFDPDILQKAHRAVAAIHGLDIAKPAETDAKTDAKAKGKRKDDIPPTLASVPASAGEDTSGGAKFAHLDRLEGEALEHALEKMPEAEQERYLAGR